jgi:uncharacterized Ntn-hydrolase superfamily protein
MTWSIVALDGSGALGVAVASRFFAVGALCPAVLARRGALSTQALINPLYARSGLALLAEGLAPGRVIERVTGADPGRDVRQFHLVDARGETAAWTGRACIEWCGHRTFPGFSVAGNMLAGPEVLEATAATYQAEAHRPFAERLIAAMQAGEAAGGDKRGKQAAALRIHTTEAYPVLDLRVDDHPEPLHELRRLHDVSLERFQPFMECLPREGDPAGITDRAVIEERIARFQAARAMRTEKA